jgi:GMP synthase-like glutamine amidotransferase
MKILIIQHSAADRSAAIGDVLDQQQHEVQVVRIDKQDVIPQVVWADVLMAFGGPFTLTKEERPDWVAAEQDLMRRYVNDNRRVLGICFGAQMLANALGATVRRNLHAEVGWHEVRRTPEGAAWAGSLPESMTVLQWHQDTFDIPVGATRLFKSTACQNQGFCVNDRVFGFQFHLEADLKTIETFLAVSPLLRRPGVFIQKELEIRQGIQQHLAAQNEHMVRFLKSFLPHRGTS